MLSVYRLADYEMRPEVPTQNTSIQPTLQCDIDNALRKGFQEAIKMRVVSFYPVERTENTGFSTKVSRVIVLLDANTIPIGEFTGDAAEVIFDWLKSQTPHIWGIHPWSSFYFHYNK